MIKFFRHIRRSLLAENKFSKYIIYAIGEIVLVVIGILLALQINTWNHNNQIENEITAHLNSLKLEVETNLNNLEHYSKDRTAQIHQIQILIESLNSDISDDRAVSLISALVNMGTNTFGSLETTAFDEITNSSLVNHIKDLGLVDYIIYSQSTMERVLDANTRVTNIIFSTILPYYYKNSNLLNDHKKFGEVKLNAQNFNHDIDAFLKNREMTNIHIEYIGWMNHHVNQLNYGINYFKEYHERIDKYLNEY